MAEMAAGTLGKKVIRNTAMMFSGGIFSRMINFVSGVAIVRSLSEARYGEWSFIYVYLSVFEMFIKFGLDSILTREMSQYPENRGKILGNAILLRLAFVLASLPFVFLVAGLLHYPLSTRQGLMLASFQLFFTLYGLYTTVFRVELAMQHVAFWNGVRSLVNMVLVGLVFFIYPSVFLYIVAAAISATVSFLGLARQSQKFLKAEFSPDWKIMKHLLREATPLLLSGYLTLIYYRIDVFMISKMKGFESVGLYSVATRISEAFIMAATLLMISLFPILASHWKNNRPEFQRLAGKTIVILLAAGLPLAVGGMFVSTDLIVLVFGARYQPSGLALAILLWFTAVGFLAVVLVNLLIICGKQIMDTWISLGLALANIALNYIWIPRFDFNGAAMATVAVQVFGTIAMAIYLARKKYLDFRVFSSPMLRVVAANLCFAAFLLILKALNLHVLFLVVFGSLFYAGMLMLFHILKWSDLQYYFRHGFKTELESQN